MHALSAGAGEKPHTNRNHGQSSSAVGPSSSESDGVIDERRDLSIETRTRRRGGPVARAMGVSLPRSWALLPIPSFLPFLRLLSVFSDLFESSPRVVFTSSSSCRRKLESTKVFRSAAVDPVDPSELPSESTKFKGFFPSNTGNSPDERIDSETKMTTVSAR